MGVTCFARRYLREVYAPMTTGQIAALAYIAVLVYFTATSIRDWLRYRDNPEGYVEMMHRRFPATSNWYTDDNYRSQVKRLPIRIFVLGAATVVSLAVLVLR
jgi:hypothetical protein